MHSPLSPRRGTALFITLIVCVGFAALAIAASERMLGMKRITKVNLAKQQAAAAAETVAAMVESKLMDAAADYTKLIIPLETDVELPTNPWWKMTGCVYKDAAGNMHGPGYDTTSSAMWVNGCLVRWMVEPVRVYSKAWSDTPSADSQFVVNPPSDPSQMTQWETAAKIGPNDETMPGTLNKSTGDFYHFRVVAQAYALADGADILSQPWKDAGSHTAAAQSLRILQIQSLQLFKYALFYAADAPTGDLDLQTGGTIWVQKGAIHSNGAIYIRGGESRGFTAKNWHWMASGDGSVDALTGARQNIFLGEAAYPVTITGVAGIFRMGKTGNCLADINNLKFSVPGGGNVDLDRLRPMDIPTERARFISDDVGTTADNRLDLNGDLDLSDRHRFNGVNFTRANDSRTPQEFVKAFKNYARDSSNGGTRVSTLQNIPELGGRPFEPQAIIETVTGNPNPLYGNGTNTISRYPTRIVSGSPESLSPLYYNVDPWATAGSVGRPRLYGQVINTTNTVGAFPVLAEGMRLWWDPAFKSKDVANPSEEKALFDQIPLHAKLGSEADSGYGIKYNLDSSTENRERLAYYDGTGTPAPPVAGTSGLFSFPGVSFTFKRADGITDVTWTPQFYGTGFSPREVKGYYLEAALFGNLTVAGGLSKQQQYYKNSAANGVAPDIEKSGLVIRERRWQQRPRMKSMEADIITGLSAAVEEETAWNNYWPGEWMPEATQYLNPFVAGKLNIADSVLPIPRPVLSATPTYQEKVDYVQYLCSQYNVLFCGRNITAPFFGQILSQTNSRDFIVTEDEFVDSRESGYMWGLYGANGDGVGTAGGTDDFYQYKFYPNNPDPISDSIVRSSKTWDGGTSAALTSDYRQNVLTIHMRGLQEWLRNTTMNTLGYPALTDTARQHFTGVIYNHRTRRSETYHPLFTPELVWPGNPRISNNVEATPKRLFDQNHFRAYWLTDIFPPLAAPLPYIPDKIKQIKSGDSLIYPPINFPWNWREPAGAPESTRCATRLKGQIDDPAEQGDPNYYRVYWDHATTTSTTDPLGTSKLTYITPQRFYMWGHFAFKITNITDEALGRSEIDTNIKTITPCAVFADNYTMQSVHWRDYNAQTLPDRADGMGFPRDSAGNSVDAESTCQFVSMVINNSPNSTWNAGSFGSAGQEGTFRMMESWSKKHYWWSGSQVVMNMGRYHHSGHNYVNKIRTSARAFAPAHMGVRAFQAGNNHYVFNTNLFSSEGRPPLSPSGVNATRVVNQVTSFGE